MLKCNQCGYQETIEKEFIGIFPVGTSLSDTNGDMCGIYACPKCNTVIYTNDTAYINERKQKYKEQKNNIFTIRR